MTSKKGMESLVNKLARAGGFRLCPDEVHEVLLSGG